MQVGEARSDQEVIIDVAGRLGLHEAFPWKSLSELNEWALKGTGMNFEEFLEKGIFLPEQRYYKYKSDEGFFNTPRAGLKFIQRPWNGWGSHRCPSTGSLRLHRYRGLTLSKSIP